jgi:hypothetical protein
MRTCIYGAISQDDLVSTVYRENDACDQREMSKEARK